MSSTLRRVFGLGFGLAVIVGSTIGIGILRAPGLVAQELHTPSTILIVWIIGGLYTLLGSICLTELGTAIPQAGGYYIYARRAFGDLVGFAVGWTDWLTYCVVLAYISIGLSEFVGVLNPSLAGAVRPVALAALAGFVALQWAGVQVSKRFQEWTTAIKCAAFLALVVAAFVAGGAASATTAPAAASATSFGGLIAALQAVIITYGGWQSALYFTEEDKDPSRNLPRAMIGGVAAVILIYALVNLALLAVLPVPDLAASKLPAATAAEALAGTRGQQIITILSIVSLVPLLNAIMMIGTRILFALGRDGMVWSRAASVNAGGTPSVATIATTTVAMVLIATGTFEQLIAIASILLTANYCVSCLALVALRRREPQLARPFRAWGYPWSAVVVIAGAVAFLVSAFVADTRNGLIAIGLLLVGIAIRAMLARVKRA